MYDLYTFGTSNGLRASVMLEETGAPYEVHRIDLTQGEQRRPDFLSLNAFGQIPVLVDRDGSGGSPVTVHQSIAIMLYLAEKHDMLLPRKASDRSAFWQALSSAATDVSAAFGSMLLIQRSPEPDSPAKRIFRDRLRACYEVWDRHFAAHAHAAGDDLTIADLALYVVVARSGAIDPSLVEGLPDLDRWAAGIGARPAVQRGMKVPG